MTLVLLELDIWNLASLTLKVIVNISVGLVYVSHIVVTQVDCFVKIATVKFVGTKHALS